MKNNESQNKNVIDQIGVIRFRVTDGSVRSTACIFNLIFSITFTVTPVLIFY